MGVRRLLTAGLTAASVSLTTTAVQAQELLGQPTPGGIGLQPAASPLKHDAHFFHNAVLLPIITAISLFVLALLLWVVVRYNKRSNPVPAKFSHNTAIEIVWTVAPVAILMFIAIFSFRLLYAYHDMPKPDLTVKMVGYQWYWGYELPDQGVEEFSSYMLSEEDAKAQGKPYRLAVDNPLVVPVGKTVRVLVTGNDVIHAIAMPAFGLKTDAIPGRINETWFRAEKEGVYYGQCSELCGVDHAFMPLQINVVSQAEWERWVVAQGGSLTPPAATTAAAAPVAAPAAEAPTAEGASVPAAAAPAAPAAAGAAPAPAQPAATPAAAAAGAAR